MEPATCLIDDFGPLSVRYPASVLEVGEQVRETAARGLAIYPLGGGTMLARGMPPTRNGVALCTTRLTEVIDYPVRNMTITVQAGITIARLQETLATERQRLPIDVPEAEAPRWAAVWPPTSVVPTAPVRALSGITSSVSAWSTTKGRKPEPADGW